jgi:hypothetical protein
LKTGSPDDVKLRPKPLNARFRSQFSVFLVFVLFSSLVWIVIKLSNDFTSTVTYNVEYYNLPADHILVKASDTTIAVGLDAQGFDLVSYHLWKKKPLLTIDLANIKLQPGDDSFSAYILTSGLTRKLASQVGSYNELISISPDTLKFEFLPEHSRQVPVIPVVQYKLRPQFMLYDSIHVYPDSIWIFGPLETIDTIASVSTVAMNFPDLHAAQTVMLKLQKPSRLPLTYSKDEVEVSLSVEKFTEKEFELPIVVDCPEGDFTLRIFPETVKIHCQVALKDYKRLDPAMFKAVVTCKPSELQSSTKIRIEIAESPSFVGITRIEPERVEFILVKERE